MSPMLSVSRQATPTWSSASSNGTSEVRSIPAGSRSGTIHSWIMRPASAPRMRTRCRSTTGVAGRTSKRESTRRSGRVRVAMFRQSVAACSLTAVVSFSEVSGYRRLLPSTAVPHRGYPPRPRQRRHSR